MFGTIATLGIVAIALAVWPQSDGRSMVGVAGSASPAETIITPVAVPPPSAAPSVAPRDAVGASGPMEASAPVRLTVPSISVDTPLMDLGLQPDGTLEVPPDGVLAGWFTGAPTPGELGPAIIAGHVDWNGPGIFYDLHLVVAGDLIEVDRADGSTAVFTVTEVGQYPKNEFPTEAVYGPVGFAGLRLITCGGLFDDAAGSYEDNVVVFAELVSSTPATSG